MNWEDIHLTDDFTVTQLYAEIIRIVTNSVGTQALDVCNTMAHEGMHASLLWQRKLMSWALIVTLNRVTGDMQTQIREHWEQFLDAIRGPDSPHPVMQAWTSQPSPALRGA